LLHEKSKQVRMIFHVKWQDAILAKNAAWKPEAGRRGLEGDTAGRFPLTSIT
jgi:hypothetical protein